MARQVITTLIDDLDGKKADRTVEFSLDGVSYTIDLSEANAGKLRKALDPYINAGTRLGRSAARIPARGAAPARTAGSRDENRLGDPQRAQNLRAGPQSAGGQQRLSGCARPLTSFHIGRRQRIRRSRGSSAATASRSAINPLPSSAPLRRPWRMPT